MGVNQVLDWDVITASGNLITASPTQNADLYWALSGGGPGAYGAAVSVTVRDFLDQMVGGASMAFAKGGNNTASDNDAFWKGVQAFMALLPDIVD